MPAAGSVTDERPDAASADSGAGPRLSRRSLLAVCSGVSAALAGCSSFRSDDDPTPADPPTRSPTDVKPDPTQSDEWAAEFGRVVDAVADLGCDPDGGSPCDAAVEDGVGADVLIRFPPGTYRFEETHRFEGFDRLGFLGSGDVSFVPPTGFNEKLLSFVGGWALFAGIDLDLSAEETTAGLRFITRTGFRIEDVTYRGRGLHPDGSVVNALALAVRDADERGVVRNVVARRGSAIGHYKGGNGRVGMWIGDRHRGHVAVEDCHLEEFGNNGIYASRCPGTVAVIGGLYRNNNVSGVRLGGGGNVVRGATVVVDVGSYTGPYTRTEAAYDTRAVVVEQGPLDLSDRVLVAESELRMVNADRSQGVLVAWPSGNGPRVERTRITNDVDWVSSVQANAPDGSVSASDRGLELVDSVIAGSGSWGSAVELIRRPGSTLDGTTIEQHGVHRDGLRLVDSSPSTLSGATITATRYPIFAVTRRPATVDCLASISVDTTLERTGPALASLRSTDVGAEDGSADAGEGNHRCIGEPLVSAIGPFEGVGITAVAEDTVSWRLHPVE